MNSKLLANPEGLSQSYIPVKLLHRDKQKAELLNCLTNSTNTFVYGNPGIGKTTLIRHVTDGYKGKLIYIDCSLYQTTNAVLREIISAISVPIFSRSNYDLLKRIKEKTKNSKLAVCLDHFEYLTEPEAVGKLIGLGFVVVLVAEKEESYLRLDQMTRSNITSILRIPEYTIDQSIAIISDRVKFALKEWSYSDSITAKIAEESKGNIALALSLLKTAALNAESQNKNKIDETDIPQIDCPELELKQDEKVLLEILEEWKSLPSSRLYAFYREKAKYPKEERSFRNYMRNLCAKGLVKAIGEKSGRVYEIVEEDVNASSQN